MKTKLTIPDLITTGVFTCCFQVNFRNLEEFL